MTGALLTVALLTVVVAPIANSAPLFEELCAPTDPGLVELSGMAVADGLIYAIGDSGTDDQVAALDQSCRVQRWLPVPIDPRDVEDLAVGPDGRLWLADLGDNNRQRETVALIGMDKFGDDPGTLHRLVYPDGPHDGEALLLGTDDVPVIVTKEIFGPAGVYVPAGGADLGSLAEPGPSPLTKVGTVQISPTDTPGGPIPGVNLPAITGGAVSTAGDVIALRTYTDVYLYPVGVGGQGGEGILTALKGAATRVPLPSQPQGEAIAFTPDGDLLAGSEAGSGWTGERLPPILVLRDAVSLVEPVAPLGSTASTSPAADAAGIAETSDSSIRRWGIGIAAAVVLGAGAVVGFVGISRRRR